MKKYLFSNFKSPFKFQDVLFIVTLIVIFNGIGCGVQANQKIKKKIQEHSLNKEDSVLFNKYKDGEKDGLWKEYDENNQLVSEGFYKNGKANGLMKWYFEGELVATGNMKNDQRDGLWKICDVHNKSNCIEASFKEDKKVGVWQILHSNGKLWKEQNWEAGKIVSERCWDEKGNQIMCS